MFSTGQRAGRVVVASLALSMLAAVGGGAGLTSAKTTNGMTSSTNCSTKAAAIVAGFAVDGYQQRQCTNARNWASGPGGSGEVHATRNQDGTCTDTSTEAIVICDGVKKGDQSVFTGGNKEANPCAWIVKPQPPPPPIKDDIANAYVASTNENGDTYVYAAMDYVGITNNPSRDFDIEFNQKLDANGNPLRQPGDILVSVDYGGNNSPETIKVFVAKTPAQDANVQTCGNETAGYDFKNPDFRESGTASPVVGTDVTAAVNQTAIKCGQWDCYDSKYNLTNTLPAGDFFSVGLNLSGILRAAGVNSCNYAYVDFRSRASGESAQSQLKDTVGPVPYMICCPPSHGY